ncbi:MAG: hypothetical protein HW383_297 [Candidatus Magasanikbacteria bacterium]|nr:hypothetical protein [Candidatus Magasanikbacteria bacterium]
MAVSNKRTTNIVHLHLSLYWDAITTCPENIGTQRKEEPMVRFIGIRHRVKKLSDGDSSPTQVCVIVDGTVRTYDLDTETDELDWVLGYYPTSWRLAVNGEDDALLNELKNGRHRHHLRFRKVKKNEDAAKLSNTHVVKELDGKPHVLEIPASYDGFKPDDVVGMALGGSGDRLAFALSRRAEELSGQTAVMRIRSAKLKAWREDHFKREKDEDAKTLAELVRDNEADFFPTTGRDRVQIRLVETWRNRVDAMKARIGGEQRLRSRLIGLIFCSEEGKYPEGEIEVAYEKARANDHIIQALIKEEAARNREIEKILRDLPVYEQIFKPVRGIGPMIAARLIVAIGDIRRFETDAKLKAFLGVHVMEGGRFGQRETGKQFVRRRQGEVANWHPDGRQALFLLTDQFNRNPNSPWGQKLLEYKAKFRTKHPSVECAACGVPLEECQKDSGKLTAVKTSTDQGAEGLQDGSDKNGRHVRRYMDGHIHKMALWRTVTKFVEWLWREWWRLEREMTAGHSAKAA